MVSGSSSESTIGMDWSKQPEKSGIERTADDFREHEVGLASPFIVVHGAGKFFGNSPGTYFRKSAYRFHPFRLVYYQSTLA